MYENIIKEFKVLINLAKIFKCKVNITEKSIEICFLNSNKENSEILYEKIYKNFKDNIIYIDSDSLVINFYPISKEILIEKEYNYQLPSNQLFNSVSKLVRKANTWNKMNDSIYFNEGV